MNLMYPPFASSDEFDALSSDLSVVGWFLKLQRMEAKEKELEGDIQSLKGKINSSLPTTCAEVLKQIEEYKQSYKPPTDYAVDRMLTDYANKKNRGESVTLRARRKEIIIELARLFSVPDVEAITAAFARINGTNDEPQEDMTPVFDQVALLERKLKETAALKTKHHSLKTIKTVFNNGIIPTVYKDLCHPKDSLESIGCVIAKEFIRLWRVRQAAFSVPVSIYGHKIDTMPTARYAVWRKAWMALELNKVSLAPIYQALDSHEAQPLVRTEFHKGLGAFGSSEEPIATANETTAE